jgi:hypothetical protein
MDALSQQYTCGRCERRQPATRGSWIERDEPHWRYRLDEVVYQFLKENGDLPVLALAQFLGESDVPIDVAYEMCLISPVGVEVEIDIVAARGFELIVGEATRAERYAYSQEPERLRELREAAGAAEARHVLLATSQLAFHNSTRERAEAAFRGLGPRLTILEAVE